MLIVIFIFLLGLSVGSFLNAWIWRLREGESVLRGRSRCPRCGHVLAWYDLIPVLSFVLLRGKCRYCREKIDIQYPLVELTTAALFVIAYAVNDFSAQGRIPQILAYANIQGAGQFSIFNFQLWLDWFFISILVVIFVYDLRYMEIPDKVTLPAIGVGMIFRLAEGFQNPSSSLFTYLLAPLLIGGGFFLLQYIVSRGRWIGGGDIRLGAFMGVALGWPGILIGLLLAYVIGSVVALALVMARRKTMQSQIAFGTFLSAATVMTMLGGERITELLAGSL